VGRIFGREVVRIFGTGMLMRIGVNSLAAVSGFRLARAKSSKEEEEEDDAV
jgi:hypothetical protein